MHHVLQLRSVLFVHDHQLIVEHALDAVESTVDLGDVGVSQAGLNNAVGGAVDNGGRAAGLTDNQGTNQILFRHFTIPPNRNSYSDLWKMLETGFVKPIRSTL